MGRYRFNQTDEGMVRFQDLEPEIQEYLVSNQYVTIPELPAEIDPNISHLTQEEIINVLEHF